MVRNGKPAPDIFLFAADKMGANPADCIVIEDSPFGIQGAVAAGMTAIGYTGGGHTYREHGARLTAAGADFVCADWQEVSRQLAGLGVPAQSASEQAVQGGPIGRAESLARHGN